MMAQDDQHAISVAKTEYREAYNNSDVQRLLAVFAPGFTDWTEGEPSFYGAEARRALELRTADLFKSFKIELFVIIIDIVVKGDRAFDWGWHKVRSIDRQTGEATDTKFRYFETWANVDGSWKIKSIITNKELAPKMLPDGESAATAAAVVKTAG
jgi:ketosteroid isomerase-like protein